MNLNIFTQSEIVMHLGWALVHSFWQLALIFAKCALFDLGMRAVTFGHCARYDVFANF
jgi:hypothetical protein